MSAESWTAVRRIFEGALDLSPEERAGFLDRECGDDRRVRAEVEELLHEATRCEDFLEPAHDAPSPLLIEGHPPARIGSFRIVRALASGGMGVVYEAEQDRPRRRVALKVLRAGLSSAAAVRRFQIEAEILGRLRHPGIAQIYEAGTYAVGSGPQALELPYFAMEFVEDALTLLQYAQQKHLSLDERLRLFRDVCKAVQHGHDKGVIHRDLKPGNILVDGSGHARIIDFGIARASDSVAGATSGLTEAGQIIGTLLYMSPEQLDGGTKDDDARVDTRDDVYALGVVLYELVCERPPFDFREKSLTEIARIVREVEPERPRTAAPGMTRDLELIILTAMEK